jgi:hypothetical protein
MTLGDQSECSCCVIENCSGQVQCPPVLTYVTVILSELLRQNGRYYPHISEARRKVMPSGKKINPENQNGGLAVQNVKLGLYTVQIVSVNMLI